MDDAAALQAAAGRLSPALIRNQPDGWTLIPGSKFSRKKRPRPMFPQRRDTGTDPRTLAGWQNQSVWEAVIALSAAPGGFTASRFAARVRECGESDCRARQAACDLKKLRGKQMVRRVGDTRTYESASAGLKAITALPVLRDK